MEIVEPTEILGGPTNLEGLNKKAIQKLSDLLDNLSPKSNPDMITAVTDAVAKLNTSLKNSDILLPLLQTNVSYPDFFPVFHHHTLLR